MFEEIIAGVKEKDVVSFDIFNTLLMRMVKKPEDIFTMVGEKQEERKLLKDTLSSGEFAIIRKEAENRAYKKKMEESKSSGQAGEYTIFDIYKEFPAFLKVPIERLAELEVETEKENIFCNDAMYELLKSLKEEGKRILLISDMYLNKSQILELLWEIGIDTNRYVDELYISCEYGLNKRDGRLFQTVCKLEKVDEKQLFHIGDDAMADRMGADKAGVASFHYKIWEDIPLSLFYEESYHKNLVPQLYSMRLLAEYERKEAHREEVGYELGALFFGPVLAVFTDWLLLEAKNRNTKAIYPIMREGELFEKLIKQAVEFYEIEGMEVKPLYLSRKSVFLPSYTEFSREMYEECLEKPEHSVEDLFRTLGVEEQVTEFEKYRNIFVRDLWKVKELNLSKAVFETLNSEDVKKKINKEIKEQRELLLAYLKEGFQIDADFMTCDIGYGGTIQSRINRLLQEFNGNISMKHYLLAGMDYGIKNYFSEVNLKGFFGTLGDYAEELEEFVPYTCLYEGFFMSDKGSTDKYKIDTNKKVIPVLAEYVISEEEHKKRAAFCDGVLAFQKLYLRVSNQRNFKKNKEKFSKQSRQDLLKLLIRILKMPTLKEAETILRTEYDQNDGSSYIWKFYNTELMNECREQGIEAFLLDKAKAKNMPNQAAYWPVGLATISDPTYFIRKAAGNGEFGYFEESMKVCERLNEDKVTQVIVYGAGEIGKDMKKALTINNIKVINFIDRNTLLWGKSVDGIIVQGLSYIKEHVKGISVVIASKRYVAEIEDEIHRCLETDRIYTLQE